jgi:hypothetical protein
LKRDTSRPASTTVPTISWPSTQGSFTPAFSVPFRVRTSWKQTPQASTLITKSRGPATGSGMLSIFIASMPPG